MKRGLFVVLEGIDGAGTTTQARLLHEHLTAKGARAIMTREPSDGPIGKLIREMLRHEIAERSRGSAEMMALLFAADRLDHNLSEIDPHLDEGAIVVSDRYDLSSLAYQSAAATEGAAGADKITWIRSLNHRARRPDLTIVVDVPAEVARARREARGGAAELYEAAALQARLAAIYLDAEALVPGDRVVHVDGTESVDGLAERIRALVADALDRAEGSPC